MSDDGSRRALKNIPKQEVEFSAFFYSTARGVTESTLGGGACGSWWEEPMSQGGSYRWSRSALKSSSKQNVNTEFSSKYDSESKLKLSAGGHMTLLRCDS